MAHLLLLWFIINSWPFALSICREGVWSNSINVTQSYFGIKKPFSDYLSSKDVFLRELCPVETFYHNCYYRGSNRASSLYQRIWVPHDGNCILFSAGELNHVLVNRRLHLIGDSVMAQVWKMLVCSLVSTEDVHLTVEWFQYLGGSNEVPNAYNSKTCPLGPQNCYMDHEKPVSVYLPRSNTTISYTLLNKLDPSVFTQIIHRLNITVNDIAVINFGLHYNEDFKLRFDMDKFVRLIASLQDDSLRRLGETSAGKWSLLFMETTPQHFPRTDVKNGYFFAPTAAEWCDPLNVTNQPFLDWRNVIANSKLKPLLPVIPIAKELYSQWDAHVGCDGTLITDVVVADCTHWCAPSGVFQYINTMLLNYIRLYAY